MKTQHRYTKEKLHNTPNYDYGPGIRDVLDKIHTCPNFRSLRHAKFSK